MKARLSTIWVIARRDLSTRARSKAFRISSLVVLVSLILGIVIPAVFLRGTTSYTVAAVTEAGAPLPAAIATQAQAAGVTVTVQEVPDRAAAVALVEAGTATAAIAPGEIVWKNTENARLAPILDAALAQIAIAERAQALGLTPAQLGGLFAPTIPTVTRLHPSPDRGPQTLVAVAGMILLFVALNFYGAYVLTGVVEEKSSRIVEILLARVRPADLLAGKVLGIGLLGISQFLALAAVAAVTLQIVRPPNLPAGTPGLIAIVVLWFILGYSFYSVLYGALGSLASRTEDAQTAIAPLTAVMLAAYFGAFAAIGNPTAWWVTLGSLLPPTAPMFMPLRAGLTDVPVWQMALAVVLMALAIVGLVQAGGRLYRGAVLHTAGRLRLRQAWHQAR
ncbi:MAG TPA: ABC transporter permease [Pilimelia sp.]|nr:ABC transporter permease [Pilimelia sp.]